MFYHKHRQNLKNSNFMDWWYH